MHPTPVASLRGKSVATASMFSAAEVISLCDLAETFERLLAENKPIELLKGKVMTPLFFENSTRTFSSFCAAMTKLGGSVVNLPIESSSIAKGESLSDTIRTMDSYSDVLVLRHPDVHALQTAMKVAKAPIFNAGNGTGEHPTQALLDVMTIRRELGRLDNLVIGLVGDLKNGRTVHSLVEMVGKNFGVKELIMVSPPSLRMPESVLTRLPTTISVVEETSLSPQIMQRVDVLYCTRLQKERFGAGEAGLMDYDAAKSSLVVNAKRLVDAKQNMIVMHPLPRNDELSDDVDGDHRAAYFKQMRYGLLMRMALLYSVLA